MASKLLTFAEKSLFLIDLLHTSLLSIKKFFWSTIEGPPCIFSMHFFFCNNDHKDIKLEL